jgi:hypothetical protein
MEDYSVKWSQAKLSFNPLLNDGNGKVLVGEIMKLNLSQELANFSQYSRDINLYRAECQQLHGSPANRTIQENLQVMEATLRNKANKIQQECQNIIIICEETIGYIKIASNIIKVANLRKELADVTTIVTEIIKKIKQDELDYSPQRIQATLDKIRRNP